MKRRTLLQSLAAAFSARGLPVRGLFRQAAPALSAAEVATLSAIAELVLPSTHDAAARERVVTSFARWVREYREGADMGYGYGASTLRRPSGPSPALQYPPQFAALDRAAAAEGAASFAALPFERRRAIVERALNEPQPVTRLPASPTGANLVADFMGFYFNGPDAWDLAYRADIGSERCRGLDGSDRPPAPLGGR